jgi:DNA-binding GntR family transcriptional regulator
MATPGTTSTRPELPGTLVDAVARHLRDGILSGKLESGSRIVEEQLCAELGISRAPLREALRLLGQQGLVEHLPRRGARVIEWSPADVVQLFELRQVLESHAVRSAVPLGDPATALKPVKEALGRMRTATDELDRDDAHRAFHGAVVGLARNRQLDIALEPILLKLQLPMARNLRKEASRRSRHDGVARHQEIVTALETNDPGVVIAALAAHGHLAYLDLSAG